MSDVAKMDSYAWITGNRPVKLLIGLRDMGRGEDPPEEMLKKENVVAGLWNPWRDK